MAGLVSLRLALGAALLGAALLSQQVFAQNAAAPPQSVQLGPSGLPLPRFVSLKSERVNSRVGPGVNYSVNWMYVKEGLPMEIIQEYYTWRRVRDAEGAEGWITQSLLSGKRTAIVAPWERGKTARINLYSDPRKDSSVVAMVEAGVIGTIESCTGEWCEMKFGDRTGWIDQSQIWGAYPNEKIKD